MPSRMAFAFAAGSFVFSATAIEEKLERDLPRFRLASKYAGNESYSGEILKI